MIRSMPVDQFGNLISDIEDKRIVVNKIMYGDKTVHYIEAQRDTDELALFKIPKGERFSQFEQISYHLFLFEGGEVIVPPSAIIDVDIKDDNDEVIAVPEISEPTPEEVAEIVKKRDEDAKNGKPPEPEEELY